MQSTTVTNEFNFMSITDRNETEGIDRLEGSASATYSAKYWRVSFLSKRHLELRSKWPTNQITDA